MSVLGTSRSLDGRDDSVKPFPVETPLCYDGRGTSPRDDCDRGTPLCGLWATLTAEIENDGGRRLPGRSRPARLGRFEKHGRDRECRSVSLLPDDSHFADSEEYSAHEFLSFYLWILLSVKQGTTSTDQGVVSCFPSFRRLLLPAGLSRSCPLNSCWKDRVLIASLFEQSVESSSHNFVEVAPGSFHFVATIGSRFLGRFAGERPHFPSTS
jgi:hypothetical protein